MTKRLTYCYFLLMIVSQATRIATSFRVLGLVERRVSSRRLQRGMASSDAAPVIPRAAVSVCVHCRIPLRGATKSDETKSYYLLVQRGKPPNKDLWSLPGGKLEYGETALQGGVRELREEVQFQRDDHDNPMSNEIFSQLNWYSGTVCTTDSIGEGFHYVIAHCYAELSIDSLPLVQGTDDAANANWFTMSDIQRKETGGETTPGVLSVVGRIEQLRMHSLLPTTEKLESTSKKGSQ